MTGGISSQISVLKMGPTNSKPADWPEWEMIKKKVGQKFSRLEYIKREREASLSPQLRQLRDRAQRSLDQFE